MIDLIFCYGGSKVLPKIAISEGWLYGSQPDTVYDDVSFTDLDWKRGLDWSYLMKYAAWVRQWEPKYAVAPDLLSHKTINPILKYVEKFIAPFTPNVILVPKIFNICEHLPRRIGITRIMLGYSVPTKYGGTDVPLWEFKGWPIHLLGGMPLRQIQIAQYLDVESADGNVMAKLATRFRKYWNWKTQSFRGDKIGDKRLSMEAAFRHSCQTIRQAWEETCF